MKLKMIYSPNNKSPMDKLLHTHTMAIFNQRYAGKTRTWKLYRNCLDIALREELSVTGRMQTWEKIERKIKA
jgi:hypothetical protein